jgi:hypothetical protein
MLSSKRRWFCTKEFVTEPRPRGLPFLLRLTNRVRTERGFHSWLERPQPIGDEADELAREA